MSKGTTLKTGRKHRCSKSVNSSCSTSGTRRVTLATNTETSNTFEKDWYVNIIVVIGATNIP
jgi:hypothetical protein